MGVVRLLFALSVVAAHSTSHPLLKFIGTTIAVQSFVMIFGFYMAMIQSNYTSKIKFWKRRYLRLYPTYIFCILVTFFLQQKFSFLSNCVIFHFRLVFLIFANLTMLLQDVTMFIGINNNTVHFTKYFIDSTPPLYQFLLIPPGWSIGLEISFYLMAPWILKKKNIYILSIICISLITRIILQFNGFIGDSWSYRFFPSELAVFLIGSQAFYIYINQEINEKKSWLSQLLYLYIILIIITFPFIPIEPQLKKLLFYCLFALSLGKIFDLTKDNKLDKLIALLSTQYIVVI
ncbi:acyltransferase family protein [Rickettsia sibirica]|uniref:acyltransferase family protein n=1 Tax=Rickettsia sibirica TaxID=35793 RepID=UPI00031F695A|nr:acyltransferase family protein [Rickettsia sibirica]